MRFAVDIYIVYIVAKNQCQSDPTQLAFKASISIDWSPKERRPRAFLPKRLAGYARKTYIFSFFPRRTYNSRRPLTNMRRRGLHI